MSVVVSVLDEVGQERETQDAKWGEQNYPDGTGPNTRLLHDMQIISDVYADDASTYARMSCQKLFALGTGTWQAVLAEEFFEALAEEDPQMLRAELIQVAAVCVAWVEAIDRRENDFDGE